MADGEKDFEELQNAIVGCRRCREDPDLAIDLAACPIFEPLRNPRPFPPGSATRDVRYLMVALEPNSSARTQAEAEQRTRDRHTNSVREMFQFAVERWLLDPGEAWAFSDVTKCAMKRDSTTNRTRSARWQHCQGWFARELALFRPRVVIALGGDAYRLLTKSRTPEWPILRGTLHFADSVREEHRTRDWFPRYDEYMAKLPPALEIEEWVAHRRAALGKEPELFKATLDVKWYLASYCHAFGVIKAHLPTLPDAMVDS